MTDRIRTYESREAWEAGRKEYIGSSDAPVLFGEGYEGQSPVTVWEEKVHGPPPMSDERREALERGLIAEEFALKLAGQQLRKNIDGFRAVPDRDVDGNAVVRVDADAPVLASTVDGLALQLCSRDERNWHVPGEAEYHQSLGLSAEPDGDYRVLGPVEAKYTNSLALNAARKEGPDGVALRHKVQLQHQLMCTGWERGWIVLWAGNDQEPVVVELPRDEEFIVLMRAKLTKFWKDHVEPKKLPPLDYTDATRAALARLWPEALPSAKILPDWCGDLVGQRRTIAEQIKHLERSKKQIEHRLMAEMGEYGYGVTKQGVVAWPTVKQEKKAQPARTVEFRRFAIQKNLPRGTRVEG